MERFWNNLLGDIALAQTAYLEGDMQEFFDNLDNAEGMIEKLKQKLEDDHPEIFELD